MYARSSGSITTIKGKLSQWGWRFWKMFSQKKITVTDANMKRDIANACKKRALQLVGQADSSAWKDLCEMIR